MKCKSCRKRMTNILTEFEYNCTGKIKQMIHVPAYQCPNCNQIIIPGYIQDKVKQYVMMEDGDIVDFRKYKEKEEEEFTVLHMLGLM